MPDIDLNMSYFSIKGGSVQPSNNGVCIVSNVYIASDVRTWNTLGQGPFKIYKFIPEIIRYWHSHQAKKNKSVHMMLQISKQNLCFKF